MSVGDTDFSPPATAVNFPIAIHLATYRGWRILAIIVEDYKLAYFSSINCLARCALDGFVSSNST